MNSLAGNRKLAGNSVNSWNAKTMRRLQSPVVFVVVALLSHTAGAGKLEDVIPGLYGGDGIRLQTPPNNHAAQFTSPDGGEFTAIGTAIGSSLNQLSTSAVVNSFTFDPTQAVFVRSDEGLGDMIAEHADTIGKGNLNIGSTYTRFDFKSFEGEDLNSLEVDFDHADLCGSGNPNSQVNPNPDPTAPPIVPIRGQLPSALNQNCFLGVAPGTPNVLPSPFDPSFENDSLSAVLDIELTQEQFVAYANYGILDNWDVGLVIPVIHTDLSVSAVATINRSPLVPNSSQIHNFCTPADIVAGNAGCDQPGRDLATDYRSEDAWGIGDVELNSKFQFLDDHAWAPDMAVLGRVRFPTGDEEDFLGAGFTSFSGALIMSRTISIFTPHANLAFDVTTGPGEFDNFRWVVGSTAKIHDRVTVASDFLGRHALEHDDIGDDILEWGVSLKFNPFSSFNFIGNAILPLNYRKGLRTAVTWGAGFEYTF